MATGRGPDHHSPTLTEQARRRQLTDVVVEVVAERGYAGASLARIAERAEITKAAVLYHYPTKDALVRAAYDRVLGALVVAVGSAVAAAAPADGPAAYVRTMITHLRDSPRHTRMIIEAVTHGLEERGPHRRQQDLQLIMESARAARGGGGTADLHTLAIMVSGAINAIVGEQLEDPTFDTSAAAEELVELTEPRL